MAITTTSLGPNSAKLDFPGGTTATEFINAIEALITANGWELYDDQKAGSSYAVYRAVNKDGSTYKYVKVWVSSSNIYLVTYETWNNSSHTGTNIIAASDNSSYGGQQLDITNGGRLYVFHNPRYLSILSYNPINTVVGSSTGGGWVGCFEATRENPEDTVAAGWPPYFWVNGYMMIHETTYNTVFPDNKSCFPRHKITVSYGYPFFSTLFGKKRSDQALYPQLPGPLINNRMWVSTIIAGSQTSDGVNPRQFDVRGKVYGLKLIGANVNLMDDTKILCNTDLFYDASGTLTDHWILKSNGVSGSNFAIPK